MEIRKTLVRDLIIELMTKELYDRLIDENSEIYKRIEKRVKDVIADEINYKEIITWGSCKKEV